jgi:hypothetical protein
VKRFGFFFLLSNRISASFYCLEIPTTPGSSPFLKAKIIAKV